MSVVVQDIYAGVDPVTQQVGPRTTFSASPWRILSILVSGEGTVEINTGISPYIFTVLKDTFTDEMAIPSATIPFPVTMGNVRATISITNPTDCGIRIVYEDGIG